jgi:hypothetical protein
MAMRDVYLGERLEPDYVSGSRRPVANRIVHTRGEKGIVAIVCRSSAWIRDSARAGGLYQSATMCVS